METQTVAGEADGQNKNSGSEVTGTQDDLDALLAEFDGDAGVKEEIKSSPTDQETVNGGDDADLKQWVKDQRERELTRQFNETMSEAVKTMRDAVGEDAEINLSDRAWRGIIHDAANSDTRVRKAFVNRHSNPAAFNKILKALAKEEAQSLKVSKSETDTRDQVNAAVRASQKNSSPVDAKEADADYRKKVMAMTPAQREAEKRKALRGG